MKKVFFIITIIFSININAKIKVGVVDTGVYPHVDIKSNIKDQVSFVRDQKDDDLDHGTYIAGTIVRDSMVNNIEIYSIKNINKNQKVPSLQFLKVVDYAIKKKIKILNVSEEMGLLSPEDFLAIKKAERYGIVFIVAAGNDNIKLGKNTSIYPCQYNLDNVLCVGSYELNKGNIKILSNYGNLYVDVFAPGGDILGINASNTYSIMSGSSVATAQVSALLANVWANNKNLSFIDAIKLMKLKMSYSDEFKSFSKTGLYLKYSN